MISKFIKSLKKNKNQHGPLLIFLFLLTTPSFWRMLRSGIFSMHDFHPFRMFEFNRCVQDLQLPCRWAADAAFEYGQPLFNFYGQFPYILGEPFVLASLSIIDTIKVLFIISLAGSALAMFFLSRYLFKSDLAAILSAVLYVYAPYRAVDVWVRGALPESLAFVLFPLILLFLNQYVLEEKRRYLIFFSVFSALLIITHNLSFLMFLPFLAIWSAYFLTINKKWYLLKNFILAGILTAALIAFYLLPVIFEGGLVNLGKTTQDYYNFRAHFTTLNQLFISGIWGYGASQFGPDDKLSFSAGHVHWIVSVLILVFILVARKIKDYFYLIVIIALAWLALFLTHGRSLPIWELAKPVSFIQFPWRLLSISALFFAIAAGSIVLLLKNRLIAFLVAVVVITITIFLNYSFFREDLWFKSSDKEYFAGENWRWHTSSAVNDFWPIYGEKIPAEPAEEKVVFVEGIGGLLSFKKTSRTVETQVLAKEAGKIQLASVYFPGWVGFVDSTKVDIYPSGDLGLATLQVPAGQHQILLKFENTPVRTVGNFLTLASLLVLGYIWYRSNEINKKAKS